MFANILARPLSRSLGRAGGHHVEQVRFVRKLPRFRKAYGHAPLVTADDMLEAEEADRLGELAFQEIRFAAPYESCSPLYDKFYHKFMVHCMGEGKKALLDKLMHDTFYQIKRIQFMRKQKREAKLEARKKEEGADGKAVALGEEEEEEIEMNPMVILKQATSNCQPVVVTKKVKRGGATYQVPFPLVQSQSEWFAMQWLKAAVMERPKPRKKHFDEAMASELLDAYYGRGKVIKRKDDIHKLADANKAYAHYRWG